MLETFRVHFNWSKQNVIGPYTVTQTGSGMFVLTIDLSQSASGSVNGTGHVDGGDTGSCTGHYSTDYSYRAIGTLDTVSGNLTLTATLPTPSEADFTLTCTNPSQTVGSLDTWPAFYPMQVTLPAVYGASAEGTVPGTSITYQLTLA